MLSLERTLLDYDLQMLRAIAEATGVELQAGNARQAASELAVALAQPETVDLILAGLSPEADFALTALRKLDGRAPVGIFVREFGDVRPLGPAAREREAPHLHPLNAVEALWYRGLIGRAFVDEGGQPEEYFYIPLEVESFLPMQASGAVQPPDVAVRAKIKDFAAARSTMVDDACTLLAYLQQHTTRPEARIQLPSEARDALQPHLQQSAALDLLLHLASEVGWISGDPLTLDPARVREFLEAQRGEQLRRLAQAWRASSRWRDLQHVPGLLLDEPMRGAADPRRARTAVLEVLRAVPAGQWSSLDALVAYIYKHHADFQRPAGDYDSLYVRDAHSREFLRGFENWERVDGALVRFLIGGPLHWLGLADIARQPVREGVRPGARVSAFRLTPMFDALVGRAEWRIPEPDTPLQIYADGALRVARAASRYDRFQAARIAVWEPLRDPESYDYQMTANSLLRAAEDGVALRHVLAFLGRACEGPLPPRLEAVLRRWGERGVEAQLRWTYVLQVRSETLMQQLRDNPRTRRLLGQALGPLAVEVRARDWQKLQQALLELGILLEREE